MSTNMTDTDTRIAAIRARAEQPLIVVNVDGHIWPSTSVRQAREDVLLLLDEKERLRAELSETIKALESCKGRHRDYVDANVAHAKRLEAERDRLAAELADWRHNVALRAFTVPDADMDTALESLGARIADAAARAEAAEAAIRRVRELGPTLRRALGNPIPRELMDIIDQLDSLTVRALDGEDDQA